MKNVIKKITAAAMAFTLLGAGSAAIKSAAPKTDNTLVASAACQYHDGTYVAGRYISNFYVRGNYKYCCCCGQRTGRVYYR